MPTWQKFPGCFQKHPEKDFTRKRKIDFQSLLHFSICMQAGTLRHELLKYFSFDSSTLSNSAFYQQRNKLLPETFPFLFQQFNSHFPLTLYKGNYRLLACDGSAFTFTRNPQDTESYFPPDGKTTYGYNQVHLVALFDLLSRRFTDCTVQPIRKKNEFLAFTQMIDRCNSPDAVPIFIADRGFHSFNVFAHAIERNAYFLIRAKDINMRRLLGHDSLEEDCFDVRIDRILTRSQSKKCGNTPIWKNSTASFAEMLLLITSPMDREGNIRFLFGYCALKFRMTPTRISLRTSPLLPFLPMKSNTSMGSGGGLKHLSVN